MASVMHLPQQSISLPLETEGNLSSFPFSGAPYPLQKYQECL